MSVRRICTAIMRDEDCVLPVSSLMVGEYGLNDLCISVPTVVGRNGVVTRVPVFLSEEENAEFQKSAAALKAIVDEAGLND